MEKNKTELNIKTYSYGVFTSEVTVLLRLDMNSLMKIDELNRYNAIVGESYIYIRDPGVSLFVPNHVGTKKS